MSTSFQHPEKDKADLLDPARNRKKDSYNVTIATISKAAFVLGKRIELSLVDHSG